MSRVNFPPKIHAAVIECVTIIISSIVLRRPNKSCHVGLAIINEHIAPNNRFCGINLQTTELVTFPDPTSGVALTPVLQMLIAAINDGVVFHEIFIHFL